MDGLLAMSALHKSLLIPSICQEYLLSVCLLPARCDDHVLSEPIHSMLELFAVTRGMRSFLQPYLEDLVTTNFVPLYHGTQTRLSADIAEGRSSLASLDQACIPKDTFTALLRLRTTLIEHVPADARQNYVDATTALELTARLIAESILSIDRAGCSDEFCTMETSCKLPMTASD
ncbi:hypothetical protein ACHAQH_009102 [Verticillium albo-atrum]